MNVTLVVTGKLEAHALGAALQQLFPTIRFTTIHDNVTHQRRRDDYRVVLRKAPARGERDGTNAEDSG